MILSILFLAMLGFLATEGNIDGAPEASCYQYFIHHQFFPMFFPPNLTLSVVQTSDTTFDVTLEAFGDFYFTGFFIQARHQELYGITPLGTWDVEGATDFKARPCPNATYPANGITHVSNTTLTSITATWSAVDDRLNATDLPGVHFKASVVREYYEVFILREELIPPTTTPPPPTTPST